MRPLSATWPVHVVGAHGLQEDLKDLDQVVWDMLEERSFREPGMMAAFIGDYTASIGRNMQARFADSMDGHCAWG